ncbi:hypothetical protein ACTQ56_11230 [[Clostridium] aminophilum]|uniref:hypothetical protein n=1 Tax=[Clostridium] aminophilum TaxID=1526 RepID=UPI003F96FF21
MNSNDYTIRPEKKEEYREVENLVRESFWNVYRPGYCGSVQGGDSHTNSAGNRRRYQHYGRLPDGQDDPDIKGYADDPCRTAKSGQRERKQLLWAAHGEDSSGIL